jgi:hypothetical protein
MLLKIQEPAEPVVKNGRRQRGIGMSLAKYLDKVLCSARAARRNDGNPNRVSDCSRQFAIEAGSSSVAVHRGQQNFACPARFRLLSPGNRVSPGSGSSAMRESFPTGCLRGTFSINGNDDRLRTKAIGDPRDQCWISKRR